MASRRSAYTLFELVLTTFVIMITAVLAIPSIESMSPGYKLNASIDAVRAAWAQARAHAIDEGRPYRFAISSGTGSYRLAPEDSNSTSSSRPYVLQDSLPPGVTFVAANGANSSSSSDGLATVAVFMPDGTARDDAVVSFQVKGAQSKTVRLRGLTGAVTVQPLGGGGAR